MFLRLVQRLLAVAALTLPLQAAPPVGGASNLAPPHRAWGAYTFRSYGGDQGLTSLSVTVMGQDETGFLWVGTEDGLFRYDGDAFRRFDAQDGLPDSYIVSLASAPDGSLWVLTKTGLCQRKGGRFTVMPAASGLPKSEDLASRSSSLACDAQSRVWIATLKGLYQGGPSGFWPVSGVPRDEISSVWINPENGTVLATQASGTIYHRQGDGEWVTSRLPAPYEAALPNAAVQDLQGRTWVRGSTFLIRFDANWGHSVDFSKALPLAPVNQVGLFPDQAGRVWVPTQNGVACFQDGGSYLLDDSWGLPGSWASSVLVDREGNLWVGSEGVHRVLGRLRWSASTRRQGLPNDTIWSIARTKDGRVWVGTQGGLAVEDLTGWRSLPELKGQPISALLPDAAGGLWVSATPPKS